MSAIESTPRESAPFGSWCVHLGLGLGQPREDPRGQFFLSRRELASLDEGHDVVQVTVRVLGLMLDDDLRRESPFLHLAGHQPHAGQTERVDARLDRGQVDARIDQRRASCRR